MSKAIYWYELHPGTQAVSMPEGAEILSVQERRPGQIAAWALVDPTRPSVVRSITGFATGHAIGGSLGNFIGTVQTHSDLVFHFFDGPESKG